MKGKYFEYDTNDKVHLEVGLLFYTKEQYLEAIRDYYIQEDCEVYQEYNSSKVKNTCFGKEIISNEQQSRHSYTTLNGRYKKKAKVKPPRKCSFRIHASRLADTDQDLIQWTYLWEDH